MITSALDDPLDAVLLPSPGVTTLVTPRTKVTVIASILALQIGGFGTTAAIVSEPTLSSIANWTNSSSKPAIAGDSGRRWQKAAVDKMTGTAYRTSTADAIQFLHDFSGLTWEQISKVFAVSRRAVHLWAAGKAMNARHEELLSDILAIIRGLPANSPSERRSAILQPGFSKPSIYDQLRMDRANAQVLKESSFRHVVDEASRS
jgi:hypothetical protein